MLTLGNLLLAALFLVLAHFGARIGTRRHALSASESFVLGHWPFLYLNLVLLYWTGGIDWTTLNRFDSTTLVTAQVVAALGLVSFLLGGIGAVFLRLDRVVPRLRLGTTPRTALRVGIVLTVVGTLSVVPNAIALRTAGAEARSTALLALAQLLVPGVLLCFQAAWERTFSAGLRSIGGAFFFVGSIAMTFNWSRRPIVVAVVGALVLWFVLRRGYLDRRLLFVAAPALLVVAVAGLFWRNAFAYGGGFAEISSLTQVLERYVDLLWLESSAFSALMVVVEANGLFGVSGEASLLIPLIFWIPRAIFPGKPSAFEAGEIVGTANYNIGPSLYGEVLVNVTILGIIPFMILLGMLLKYFDLSAARQRLSGAAAALYVILVLDMIFLVRGSFHTMFTPAILHLFVPLVLFKLDRCLVEGRARFTSYSWGPRPSSEKEALCAASTPLRVFNVLFDDRFGGPQKRVTLVASRARARGVETTMVLPAGSGNAEELARASGLPVLRLGFHRIPRPRNLVRLVGWLLILPLDIARFLRLYRRHRPDVVHVNGGFFVAPAWAARLAGIPLVWHLNDIMVPSPLAFFIGAQVRLIAAEVVVSSRAVARHYKIAPSKATVLYPPVDTEAIKPQDRAAAPPTDESPLRIGLIANWTAIKGVDHFVRAAAGVHEELGSRMRVYFAGARLSNHAIYHRQVDALIDQLDLRPVTVELGFQPDVSKVLAELDVVVLASITEAAPVVVLEGMAAGLPVVASDVGGVKELLLRNAGRPAGITVPVSDSESMANAILELAGDPSLRHTMGANGRHDAEESFSTAAVVERHMDVYYRAVGKPDAREHRLEESRR